MGDDVQVVDLGWVFYEMGVVFELTELWESLGLVGAGADQEVEDSGDDKTQEDFGGHLVMIIEWIE